MEKSQMLIDKCPSFLVLKRDDGYYTFYNAISHKACKLTELELKLLDMYYKYVDKEYIIGQFPESQKEIIKSALDIIDDKKFLSVVDDLVIRNDISYPNTYYIHLTYKCNLRCTYCYNKDIRKHSNDKEMDFSQWKIVLDKILPYVEHIVFTGGECFLSPYMLWIAEYVKSWKKTVSIACISNGMHNFSDVEKQKILKFIDELTLSCDSIEEEGERIGFVPELYKKNVEWLKENYPNISLTVATTVTVHNVGELEHIQCFCKERGCRFSKTVIIPNCCEEIALMPSYEELRAQSGQGVSEPIKALPSKRIGCSAAKSVCSIDPYGNVFPCQSLHYDEFFMGNLLSIGIDELKYISDQAQCLPTVCELEVCSKCKVKYICGGGCLATGYNMYGRKADRNHLTCKLNYDNSIKKLLSLDNRLD